MYTDVDSWSLPNNSIIHATHFQNNPERYAMLYHFLDYPQCMWRWHSALGSCQGAQPRWQHYLNELRKQIKIHKLYVVMILKKITCLILNFTQLGKGPYKGIIENQEMRKVGLSETHAPGNREASTHNNWWKANWWNKCEQERSTRTKNDEVW